MSDTATKLLDKHGERIQAWENSDNVVLRELARAIKDNANGSGS